MTHFSKRTPVGADLCVRQFTGSARALGKGRTRRLPEAPGSRKKGGHTGPPLQDNLSERDTPRRINMARFPGRKGVGIFPAPLAFLAKTLYIKPEAYSGRPPDATSPNGLPRVRQPLSIAVSLHHNLIKPHLFLFSRGIFGVRIRFLRGAGFQQPPRCVSGGRQRGGDTIARAPPGM